MGYTPGKSPAELMKTYVCLVEREISLLKKHGIPLFFKVNKTSVTWIFSKLKKTFRRSIKDEIASKAQIDLIELYSGFYFVEDIIVEKNV